MNPAELDERLEALLELVDTEGSQRCQQLLDEAQRQADELVRNAFHNARHQVHQAIAEERSRGEARIRQTRAQIETRNRHRRHQALLKLLHQAWEPLMEALQARWADEAARRQWVAGLVDTAKARLPATRWTLRHPTDWPEAEQTETRDALAATLEATPRLIAEPDMVAGLRIEAEGTVLDGTPEGLLADRPAIEARLLAHLQTATGQTPEDRRG